jgi:hypothetical protein
MLSCGKNFKIDAKLSAIGLELRLLIPNGLATNDELAHFTPKDVVDRMSNHFEQCIVLDVRFDGRGERVEVILRGGVDFGLHCLVKPTWEGVAVIKISTMHIAPWLDIYGLQDEMFFHEKLYRYLEDRRATHLISKPPSLQPPPKEDPPPAVVEVVEAEIVEAEIVEQEQSTTKVDSIIVFGATSEPTPQQSISGLGLRRFMRSGFSFARDVAVDVTSRTLARVFSGQ